MTVDLTPVLQAAASLVALSISAATPFIVPRILQLFRLKVSAQQVADFDRDVVKSAQAGAVWVEAEAAQKGWDHPDVTNNGVATGVQYFVDHFQGTLKAVRLDPNNPEDAKRIGNAIARSFPVAAAPIAASPLTTNGPQTPATPIAAVAPPALVPAAPVAPLAPAAAA